MRQFWIGGVAVAFVSLVTLVLINLFIDDVISPGVVPDGATNPSLNVGRWIDVDRSTSEAILFVGSRPRAEFTDRLGKDQSDDSFYATAIGTYEVYSMKAGLAPTSFYPGGYLTVWVGFDSERSNGFHSPVRDANGVPFAEQGDHTLGCIRLSEEDARTVFDFAELGMRIEVHD